MVQLATLNDEPVLTEQEYCTVGLGGPTVPYAFSGQPVLLNNQYVVSPFSQIPIPPEPEPESQRLGDPGTKRKEPKPTKPREKPAKPLRLEKGLEYFKAKYKVEQRQVERAQQAEVQQQLQSNRETQAQLERDIADLNEQIEQYRAIEQSNVAAIGDLSETIAELQASLVLVEGTKQAKMNEEAILNAIIKYFF